MEKGEVKREGGKSAFRLYPPVGQGAVERAYWVRGVVGLGIAVVVAVVVVVVVGVGVKR